MFTELLDERQRQRRFTVRWIGLIVLVLLLGASLSGPLVLVSRNHGAQTALNDQIASMRTSGQPVTFADLDPRLMGKSFQQGERLVAALAKLPSLSERFPQLYEELMERPRQLPEGVEKLESALAESRPLREHILALVHEAPIYVPRDYSVNDPYSVIFPEITSLRECCRQMSLEHSLALARRDRDRAQALVLNEWDLAAAFEHDPFMVSYLVRLALLGMAIEDTKHLLGRLEVTDAWRQELDQRLRDVDATLRVGPLLAAEAAMTFTFINKLRDSGIAARMQTLDGLGLRAVPQKVPLALGFGFAREQEEGLSAMLAAVEFIDVPGPLATGQLQLQEIQRQNGGRATALAELLRCHPGACRAASLRCRQAVLNARLALRVDRYYREQGKLPEQIDTVLDASLATIPKGLFSGELIIYEHDHDSFQVFDPIDPEQLSIPLDSSRFEVSYGEASTSSPEPTSGVEPAEPQP